MEQVKCFIPETLEEALRIRKETGATVLAGGSDLMVANSMGAGVTPAFKGDVLIITNLKELKGIRALPDGSVEIGACTTSAEIARSPIAPELLKDAASRMGAIALRNSATIGGNIGNASPKGDMPQPLILMDAEVVLTSVDGERRMLVDDYIIATKKTTLREDEIITKVIIPKQDFTHTFFRKIGMRRANAISKLTLSAAATVRDGVVVDFRASSGAGKRSASFTPVRKNFLTHGTRSSARTPCPNTAETPRAECSRSSSTRSKPAMHPAAWIFRNKREAMP